MVSNRYARKYYDSLGKTLQGEYSYDRWFSSSAAKYDFYQTRAAFFKALGQNKHRKILEIGCGDGIWSEFLALQGGQLDIIEQSEGMLKRAKKRLKDFSNVKFFKTDFLKSKSQAKYDLVVSVRAFEYFEDKSKAAALLYKFLKSGGKLLLITKNSKRKHKTISHGSEKLHSLEASRGETENLLKKAGFKIKRIYPAIVKKRSDIAIMRELGFVLFYFSFFANKIFKVVDLFPKITESYVFIAIK